MKLILLILFFVGLRAYAQTEFSVSNGRLLKIFRHVEPVGELDSSFIEFDDDQVELDEDTSGQLEDLAQNFRGGSVDFLVEATCNSAASEEINLALSELRAKSVADVLQKVTQISSKRIYTIGYGETSMSPSAFGHVEMQVKITLLRPKTAHLSKEQILRPLKARRVDIRSLKEREAYLEEGNKETDQKTNENEKAVDEKPGSWTVALTLPWPVPFSDFHSFFGYGFDLAILPSHFLPLSIALRSSTFQKSHDHFSVLRWNFGAPISLSLWTFEFSELELGTLLGIAYYPAHFDAILSTLPGLSQVSFSPSAHSGIVPQIGSTLFWKFRFPKSKYAIVAGLQTELNPISFDIIPTVGLNSLF